MSLTDYGFQETWVGLGEKKVTGLCDALDVSRTQRASALNTFRLLIHPWGDQPMSARPEWPSDITDDHSPFEVSLSMEGESCDLRVLVEAQGPQMAVDRGWRHALALTDALNAEPGVSLDRFRTVQHLFEPDPRVESRFGLWHAAVVPPEGPVLYKLYLNPQVLGSANAPGLVREALEKLNVDQGWEAVQQLMAVDATGNELLYFALDLADTPRARVKVYVAHHGIQASVLNKQLSLFSNYYPGHANRLIHQLADHDGPFKERPVLTCLGFSGSQAEPEVTLHFPIRCYADNDASVVGRLERVLGLERGRRARQAIEAYAQRPLEAGRGLITYISIRPSHEGSDTRTVIYLSPEAYEVSQPLHQKPGHMADVRQSGIQTTGKLGADQHANSLADVEQYIAHRQRELTLHPYIQRLQEQRDPSDVLHTAKGLCFFVMAFQDVLRIAAEKAADPVLAPFIRNHFAEDAGHDRWFLADLQKLGIEVSIPFLFSADHKLARDVGYTLVAEALHTTDAARLAMVLALEANGHVFFAQMIAQLEACGLADNLQYFGRFHEQIEHDHSVFEGEAQEQLETYMLNREQLARVRRAIDLTFDQIDALASDLLLRIEQDAVPKSQVG